MSPVTPVAAHGFSETQVETNDCRVPTMTPVSG